MTYTKPLKTVTFTLHDASTVVAADTATQQRGTNALDQFLREETVLAVDAPEIIYIPFHAIVKAVVTYSVSGSIDRADPICGANDGSDDDGGRD